MASKSVGNKVVEAEAVRFQAEAGDSFKVSPNGHGLHVRCISCGNSATYDRVYLFVRNHMC